MKSVRDRAHHCAEEYCSLKTFGSMIQRNDAKSGYFFGYLQGHKESAAIQVSQDSGASPRGGNVDSPETRGGDVQSESHSPTGRASTAVPASSSATSKDHVLELSERDCPGCQPIETVSPTGEKGVPGSDGLSGQKSNLLGPGTNPTKSDWRLHACPKVPVGFAGFLGHGEACRLCGWKATDPTQTARQRTKTTGAGYPLSEEAIAFEAMCFPCEPPCDSYSACLGCADSGVYRSGYHHGWKARGDTPPTATELHPVFYDHASGGWDKVMTGVYYEQAEVDALVAKLKSQAPAVSDKGAEIARLHAILREPYKCTQCGARTDHQWGRSCPGTATTCHWIIDTSYTRSDVSRPDTKDTV